MSEFTEATRFRAVYIPQIPMHALTIETKSMEHAVIALDSMIQLSLFEFENRVKPDYADFAGIEYFDTDEDDWNSIEDEEWESVSQRLHLIIGNTKEEN